MKVHKFIQLDDLNEFLETYKDDSNLYVRIVFNKKNEEVYYVVEKNSYKHQRFEKRFDPSEVIGPKPKY